MREGLDPKLCNMDDNLAHKRNDMFPSASYVRSLHLSTDSGLSSGRPPTVSGFAELPKESLQGHSADSPVRLSLSSR